MRHIQPEIYLGNRTRSSSSRHIIPRQQTFQGVDRGLKSRLCCASAGVVQSFIVVTSWYELADDRRLGRGSEASAGRCRGTISLGQHVQLQRVADVSEATGAEDSSR